MKKKRLVGMLLVTAMVLGVGLFGLKAGFFLTPAANAGSGVTVTAPAATTTASSLNEAKTGVEETGKNVQEPNYAGSIKLPEKDFSTEATESTYLVKLAKITPDKATEFALGKVQGVLVGKPVLENENGNLVYSVSIKDTSGVFREVKVDAGNGKVLCIEQSGNEESEARQEGKADTDAIEEEYEGQSGSETDTP